LSPQNKKQSENRTLLDNNNFKATLIGNFPLFSDDYEFSFGFLKSFCFEIFFQKIIFFEE